MGRIDVPGEGARQELFETLGLMDAQGRVAETDVPMAHYYQLTAAIPPSVYGSSETHWVPLPSIERLGDAALRGALVEQARRDALNSRYALLVVAHQDGSFFHATTVPRRGLIFPSRA